MTETGAPVTLEGEQGDVAACLNYLRRFDLSPGVRLLDVGCRYGSLLRNLQTAGFAEIHGVDVDAAAVVRGRAAYPDLADRLHAYDGVRLPFPDQAFDVVTMFDVIEHIAAIDAFLTEVRRVLKPGGLLVFQTPNILIDVPYWVLALRLFSRAKLAQVFQEHCSLQTLSSLGRLLRRAGFRDVRIGKNRGDSAFKREHVTRTIGRLGLAILVISEHFPLFLYPNFWGSARR